MVAPSALAETVTPPIFSPAAETTVPLRIGSPARASGEARTVATMAQSATRKACARDMAFLLRSAVGGQRLHIDDDRVDLVRREMILEAGHARRPVEIGRAACRERV